MDIMRYTSDEAIDEMVHNTIRAALTCKGKGHKADEVIPKVYLGSIIEQGHDSVLEHITVTYEVCGISRALLQELARHRHISLSVESTRHTLAGRFASDDPELMDDLGEAISQNACLGLPGIMGEDGKFKDKETNECFISLAGALDDLLGAIRDVAKAATCKNDKQTVSEVLKYYLPECMPVNLFLTLNLRELRHILKLRTSPYALKEFQALAYGLYQTFPEEYQWLLDDCVDEGVEERIDDGMFSIELIEEEEDDDEEDEEDGITL